MKKLATYLVTLGMMLSMIPAPVTAADSTTATTAVTAETTEKEDKNEAAVSALENMNVILRLTDGADSTLTDYTKVTDERFKTIDSVKKLIADTCTDDLKDVFQKRCDKCLLEKEDGLYTRNSGRSYLMFLTDNGVEIVDPAMDGFVAVTKKSDQMNDYGRVVFRAENGKWKVSSYEFGFFTVNKSEEDLRSAAYVRVFNLKTIFDMLSYGAPQDSADKITVNGVTFGKAKDEWQENGLKFLKDTINENCTGDLRDSLLIQAENRFIEKNGVLYATTDARGSYDFNTDGGMEVTDVTENGFTAVTKKASEKDGYAKIVFVADEGKWRIRSYRFTDTLEDAVDPKELAGTWRYEISDGNYTVDVCAKYNGIVTINEDGTYTHVNADGKKITGKVTSSVEKYSTGQTVPVIMFSEGDAANEFGGYYSQDYNQISLGNGGMAWLVRDKDYNEDLNKLAVDRIENYLTADMIVSGGLEFENKEAFKVGAISYYKVTDKKFTSIEVIKKFINENTTGDMNKSLLKYCDDMFMEKDGVLYECFAGKGSVGTDTSQGVIITDKTDKSFKATTIKPNGIIGSGHTRATFTADGDTWKLSGIEYDTYTYNKSLEDFETCASARVSTMIYCMDYIEGSDEEEVKDKIKVNGAEYRKTVYASYSIDQLKNLVKNSCTGQLRENLLSRIDDRLIEKDGVLYRKATPAQAHPSFNMTEGMKILRIFPDEFKAATVAADQKDGYGVFEFVKEGDRFLLSSYTLSSLNEERLFGGYVKTESGGLNLREKPNTASSIIVEIPKGTQLDIYESDTIGWYKVVYGGNIGYVSADFIDRIPDSDIPVSTTTTTATTTSATSTTTVATTTTSAKSTTAATTTTSAKSTAAATTTTTGKSTTAATTTTTGKSTTAATTTTAAKSTTTAEASTTAAATTTSSNTTALALGDVTGDGIIDGRDATDVLTDYAKSSTGQASKYNEEQKKAADVNGDGIIDGRDATIILTYYAYTSTGHSSTLADFVSKNTNASGSAK